MDERSGCRQAQPDRSEVREDELLLGRLAEDAHVGGASVADEITRACGVAAVLGALCFALLRLLDLTRDGSEQHVPAERRVGKRAQRGEIRHERTLHVRDPEPVDPAFADESFGLEPGDPGQPRFAAGVRRIHVTVEHQRRPAACSRPGCENVRAPVLDLLPLHGQTELLALAGHPGRHGLLRAGEARDRHGRQGVRDQALAVDHRSGPPIPGSPASRGGAGIVGRPAARHA